MEMKNANVWSCCVTMSINNAWLGLVISEVVLLVVHSSHPGSTYSTCDLFVS